METRSVLLTAAALAASAGCTTIAPRTFVASTYHAPAPGVSYREAGHVRGESCERRLFGWLLVGDAISTSYDAVADALDKQPNTLFLANVAMDEEHSNEVIFTKRCIIVHAVAMTAADGPEPGAGTIRREQAPPPAAPAKKPVESPPPDDTEKKPSRVLR